MKWFDRWFAKKSREAWENANSVAVKATDISAFPTTRGGVDKDADLNFKIYSATGGYVMEFRRYDRRTDNSNTNLYVIGKEDDIGERVARIVNMEIMK